MKSRVSGFSRAKLEEGRKSESCFEGLIFARFQSVRCADHPRIHSSPPYVYIIARASSAIRRSSDNYCKAVVASERH